MTASKTVVDACLTIACMRQLCADVAQGLYNAQTVLRDNAESADVAHLVADALSRLGAMAELATTIAGDPARVGGSTEGWLLGGGAASALLADLRQKEAVHG